MAWLKSHDNQVDPFNAGEPTLPWEDPEPFHEDADCELAGESYESPTKEPDDYDAPSNGDPSVRELVGGLFSSGDASGGGREGKRAAQRKRPARSGSPANAGTARRTNRKKTFKLVKWVILAVVLIQLLPLLIGASSFAATEVLPNIFGPEDEPNEYPLAGHESPDFPEFDPDLMPGFSEDDPAKQAILDVCAAMLEAEKSSGSATHGAIARALDASLVEGIGYSSQDLGIDAQEYASWMLAHFAYEVDSAYAFDDGTGTVYFDAEAPIHFVVAGDAIDALYRYLDGEGLMEAQGDHELGDAQKDAARGIFQEVLDQAETDTPSFGSVDLTEVDGAWTLDEEGFTEEVTFALGVF